ncbi:unnamed protein product [Phyllotreta striolata]|uniref:Peptidoglycan-recognition protein n=1 Tax=Phyllotreta striolata TaxID=444603 RepID=A0A9N9TTI4_PHYSR|nr:unnamed protein product [Phyllotreta striolata]
MLFKSLLIFVVLGVCCLTQTKAVRYTVIWRENWDARWPKKTQNLDENPPPFVVIHHSETPECNSTFACKKRVKNIQEYHMDTKGWDDIGYNFLIGGDGFVYEGRSWRIRGAHLPKYNGRSIGICMIGSFQNVTPPNLQMDALKNFIQAGVEHNLISLNYELIGHRQGKATDCPGDALFNLIKEMPRWSSNPK